MGTDPAECRGQLFLTAHKAFFRQARLHHASSCSDRVTTQGVYGRVSENDFLDLDSVRRAPADNVRILLCLFSLLLVSTLLLRHRVCEEGSLELLGWRICIAEVAKKR